MTEPKALPVDACDGHMHVIGPFAAYPLRVKRDWSPPEALWRSYREEADAVGLARTVVIQPSFYGTDNRCTLDAVAGAGGRARAVVVVDPAVSRAEVESLHLRGARGVRFNLVSGGLGFDDLRAIADRIREFGWHIQIYADARRLPDVAPTLRMLDVDLVFDHMAHAERDSGIAEAGFGHLLRLMDGGRSWTKLSNARFKASAPRARKLIAANVDRIVWGSDWPHVIFDDEVPSMRALVDDLMEWTDQDPTTIRKILVENPHQLYFRT